MKYRTSTEFRQLFLDFFVTKGHVIEPSSPLVPKDDPTLLWINSGVAALKHYFDGSVTPPSRRIVNSQKALRANDIENVGVTARHHTFFEMLGNFSIGDYFRPEAISYAWEFLTSEEWVGFDPQRLYVTVYPTDTASFAYWRDVIGLPEDHIVLCEDNFWEIGEGPCGPCTEIFYDRGVEFNGDTAPEELVVAGENDRYIEIWNVVFSQFDARAGQTREEYAELPTKNIDTGMGLERMVAILQGGKTNFDTDLFLPIIAAIEQKSGVRYENASAEQEVAFKLIADHIRAITFAIADGALPSNEGRGYVIRRLLRRAVRFGKKLGLQQPFLATLVPIVSEIMKGYYSYLTEKQALIEQIVASEEQKFLETLADGEKKLAEFMANAENNVLSGSSAFMLYDTYGFPLELTQEIAAEAAYEVDVASFNEHMSAQKTRARVARVNEASMQQQNELLQSFTTPSEFVGYTVLETEVKPILIAQGDVEVETLITGQSGALILDKTPFYAESGGQVSDGGRLFSSSATLRLDGVKKAPNGQHLHLVYVEEGTLTLGTTLTAVVDTLKRRAIARNHTATHLLQSVLRGVLGAHIEQAGSLVDAARMRFDFTHFEALSQAQLATIEAQVNARIWQAIDVNTEIMPLSEAKALGAMALFGEKYGTTVRVVQAGTSIELCGGTHVLNTEGIGLFKIVSESGIGSGVRRIEAVTGAGAYEYLQADERLIADVQQKLKKKQRGDIVTGLDQLLQANKALEAHASEIQRTFAEATLKEAAHTPVSVGPYNMMIAEFTDLSNNELKKNVDIIKEQFSDYIVVLIGLMADSTNIVIAVSPSQTEMIQSNTLVRAVNDAFNGRGGGKPEIAQTTIKKQLTKAEIINFLQNNVK
jgi:alanyl-tRNA synthetase